MSLITARLWFPTKGSNEASRVWLVVSLIFWLEIVLCPFRRLYCLSGFDIVLGCLLHGTWDVREKVSHHSNYSSVRPTSSFPTNEWWMHPHSQGLRHSTCHAAYFLLLKIQCFADTKRKMMDSSTTTSWSTFGLAFSGKCSSSLPWSHITSIINWQLIIKPLLASRNRYHEFAAPHECMSSKYEVGVGGWAVKSNVATMKLIRCFIIFSLPVHTVIRITRAGRTGRKHKNKQNC